MAFACFPRLPVELCERVWLFSLPDDTPEVCLAWPVLLQSYNTPSGPRAPVPHGPLVVDTDFPAIMHTCREARQLTLSAARSGIRFRTSQLAGCPVPFRLFQPELDILYIGCDAHYLFSTVPYCFNNRLEEFTTHIWPEQDAAVVAVMQKAQHLAVPLLEVTNESNNFMAYVRDFATATKTVSLVVPGSTFRDLRKYSLEWELLFKQPARRCRLRPLSPSEMDTNCAMPTPGSQFSLSAIEMEGPQTLNTVMRVIREPRIDYKQLDDAGIQTLIQTFEERQPDGTYAEVCQDRRYINNLVFGSYPAHDFLSWMKTSALTSEPRHFFTRSSGLIRNSSG